MAKDGTNRGGARVGAGRKSKALVDKINSGTSAQILELPEPPVFEGEDVPPIKEYLKAKQKMGKDLCAEEVYKETWNWLKERGCANFINKQLIEQYAMSVSRWIQCEECISEYGFLAKCDCKSICSDEPDIHEAGESDLVSDFPSCKRELFCRMARRHTAGRCDGKIT